MMNVVLRKLALVASCLALGSCGSLIDLDALQDDTRLFTLRPSIEVSRGPSIDQSLLIDEPLAKGAIDGLRMAVMVSPTEISYASTASWESRPAELFHRLLSEAFEKSARLTGITTTGSNLAGGFRLQTDLREFHVVFLDGGGARVVVTLKAALFAAGERFQSFEQTFSSGQIITSRELDVIVDSFNQSAGEVVEELVVWAIAALGEHEG